MRLAVAKCTNALMRSHQCGSLGHQIRMAHRYTLPPDIEAIACELQTRMNLLVCQAYWFCGGFAALRHEVLVGIHLGAHLFGSSSGGQVAANDVSSDGT